MAPLASKPAALVIDALNQQGIRVVLPAKLVKDLQDAAAVNALQLGRLPWSNLMIGAALSLTLACVGVGLVRSQQRLAFVAVPCLAGIMFLGLGCWGPQKNQPNNPVSIKVQEEIAAGKSAQWLEPAGTLEVRSDTEQVQIVVNKDAMRTFIDRNGLKVETTP